MTRDDRISRGIRIGFAFALAVLGLPLLGPSASAASPPASAQPEEYQILEQYPSLRKLVYEESPSRYSLGFGITPVGILKEKVYIGLNLFQLYWTQDWLDWQVVNASIGFGITQTQESKSRHATLRTAPMYRLFEFLSIGPMLGYELVQFQNLQSKYVQTKAIDPESTDPQPFSTHGMIFGVMASQRFQLESGNSIRVTQTIAKQNYAVDSNREGWKNNFNGLPATDPTFTAAPSSIRPSLMLSLEISLLF